MTDPINHRLAGQSWLENAIDWYGQIDDSDPWEKATASAWIAGALFLDTLAEDDTVESPRFHGIAYHDDNGAGYEPVSAAAIHRHDHPGRTDFYGTPGPWDVA